MKLRKLYRFCQDSFQQILGKIPWKEIPSFLFSTKGKKAGQYKKFNVLEYYVGFRYEQDSGGLWKFPRGIFWDRRALRGESL